jgi:hypothetical protein
MGCSVISPMGPGRDHKDNQNYQNRSDSDAKETQVRFARKHHFALDAGGLH